MPHIVMEAFWRRHEIRQAIIPQLERMDTGEDPIVSMLGWNGEPTTPRKVYAGNMDFVSRDGWTITVFFDCPDWDYIDTVADPDGRKWDFDTLWDTNVYAWRPSDGGPWDRLLDYMMRDHTWVDGSGW